MAAALDTSPRTVFRTKRRYAEEGLEGVLDDLGEAHPVSSTGQALIALACNDAPEGHEHWTPAFVSRQGGGIGVGAVAIPRDGQAQKKHPQTLAEAAVVHLPDERGVCGGPRIPDGAGYGGRAGPVCRTLRPPPAGGVLRRTSTQLLADVREPLPAQPGRPRRQDYEYRRGGTRNIFLACEPLAGWRHVAITERRTMPAFAHQMRWLVDVAYPRSDGQDLFRQPRIEYGAGSEFPSYGTPLRDVPGC